LTPRKKSDEPGDAAGFEALYRRLEETVGKLEAGNLSLEESLSLYEEGMTLARKCQELLQDAELRITRLQEQFAEGTATLRDEVGEYEPNPEFGEEERVE
jgi:exodeoxyribonuclease VII small subunit